ncbi:MarR family transcriptional regulator [Sinomonas atrocyanea]|uniref:MarR family transcriptional regulator n=1 Tax=Sinomonas atrocyanea TaxID=37927 RepID=A0A127A488_9MICC|nr:MarR family transcriptional regulator [Sinomonas atrocyanea]AMM34239.1 MarR family transcriptional regulator [Sinomonas atrocyanea]GEB64732.1 transcriptional regulator [Sinomonas atrocyanea]GGG66577.1 transcriptional regulator [Sinomonas atrocyanea]
MTESRWLDAQERRAWLALLSVTTLLPAALDAHLTQLNKLSLFDYNVLAMLSEAEGRMLPMKELASRTSASLSRLSHVVTKLQARGWIDRRPSPDDARVTTAHLTDAGWETIVDLAPEHVGRVRQLVFDALGAEDVARLADIGEKVVGRLQPESWIFRDPSREGLLGPAHDGEVAP